MQYPVSELVLNAKGQVYHLGISPEQIANDVILVGDQDRVALVSAHFDTIVHTSQHREFVCHVGTYKGKLITVISTGIGTDNIDITMHELDALVNIDLENRTEKEKKRSLSIVRIGTCGIVQPSIPLHAYILSTHAFGLDNVAHFYQIPYSTEEKKLCAAMEAHLRLPEKIKPYLIESSVALSQKLRSEKTYIGITVTSSGFYGPQGRELRIKNSVSGINERLTHFEFEGQQVVNFEMESSAIFALGKTLGHACATICLGVANRPNMAFSQGYTTEMNEMIRYVLDRI
jgi:uridine phosphorylase